MTYYNIEFRSQLDDGEWGAWIDDPLDFIWDAPHFLHFLVWYGDKKITTHGRDGGKTQYRLKKKDQ